MPSEFSPPITEPNLKERESHLELEILDANELGSVGVKSAHKFLQSIMKCFNFG